MEFLFETLEALGVFVDRADVLLEDDVLRRGRTDDFREASEVGWAPSGPARVADIMSEQKGLEAELRGLEIAHRIFTRSRKVADGFIFNFGDIDGAEIP